MEAVAQHKIGLILSGAFVNDELVAEYGKLPPAFLPFGQRRLFEHQVSSLAPLVDSTYLTIPQGYSMHQSDINWLSHNQVHVVQVPHDLTLGESISYALITQEITGTLYLLHGDTLITEIKDFPEDCVAVSEVQGAYQWGNIEGDSIDQLVLAGFFSFSSAQKFLLELERTDRNFIQAISSYARTNPLQRIKVGNWLDFGHLQNLYHARKSATTQRHFNNLDFDERSVFKSGKDLAKVKAESDWFETVPPRLRLYIPPFLGWSGEGYRLGYEVSPNLHDLFVFGEYREATWSSISTACFEFLEECALATSQDVMQSDTLRILTSNKTHKRLNEWSLSENLDLNDSWKLNGKLVASPNHILNVTDEIILKSKGISSVMHGDFCFTNIFYDFREQAIRVIDPRGRIDDGASSIYGDALYDLAKLNHSLSGYDEILAGRFNVESDTGREITFELEQQSSTKEIHSLFKRFEISGISIESDLVRAITIQLFLAMLPLHSDRPDRQLAFFANALRLYGEIEA